MKLLKIVAVIIALILCSLTLRDSKNIPDHPLTEDSFYSLAVAKNISHGQYFSIDGINPTNGFQPLYTMICSVPYFLCERNDLITPLRIVLLFSILNIILSAFIFGKIIKDLVGTNESFIIAFFVFISSPLLFVTYLNGLETGLVSFMLLFTWYIYSKIDLNETKHVIRLGIILGFCVLTRIDMVWLVTVISLSMFFRNDLETRKRVINFFLISGFAFLISSPWWLHNYFIFGSIMPTSGTAQQLIDFELSRFYIALDKILVNLIPHLYFWDRGTIGLLGMAVRILTLTFLIIFIRVTFKKSKKISTAYASNIKSVEFIKYIIIFSLILIIWYSVTSWATNFYQRYFTHLSLIGLLLISLAFVAVYVKKPKLVTMILVVISLPLITGTIFTTIGYKVKGSYYYNHQLTLVQKNVPESVFVASRQSGTLGYFKKNTVNCDGKVNNDIFKYTGRLETYLQERNITWVCDWQDYTDSILGKSPETKDWLLIDSSHGFLLFKFKGHKSN